MGLCSGHVNSIVIREFLYPQSLLAKLTTIYSWSKGGSSEKFRNLEHKTMPFIDSQGRAIMPGTNSGTVNTVVPVACPTPLCEVGSMQSNDYYSLQFCSMKSDQVSPVH